MWGAGWAAAGIFVVSITILFALIAVNTAGIEKTHQVVAQNERLMNRSVNSIEHTLTIMSINQKRQMEKDGLDYLDPEPIHFGTTEEN